MEQLARFRDSGLAGADLLEADDHMAVCEECRQQLQALPTAVSAWAGIGEGLRASAECAETHLPYEQLQAYVDGAGSTAEKMRAQSHLTGCESCRGEAENLQVFAASVNARPVQAPRMNRYLILGPIAATLLVGVLLMRQSERPQPPVTLAVAVRDGGQTVGLDHQGHVVGAGQASASEVELLASTLRDGKVAVNVPDGLRASKSVLLGSESTAPHFRVRSPVGQLVLEDAPVFRWEPLENARAYKVQIFDADYQPVASSPEVAGTSWTPEHPLERGKRYVWQVTALRPGATVKAPEPPDAEARFQVLGGGEASAIQQARQVGAGHLTLTALYAHAGLCREASGEVDALAAENPGSPFVQQLRSNLAGQCEGGESSSPQRR